MCPLSVAGDDSGKYFLMALVVRPGHVGSWLFSTAFSRVAFGGLKRHWCRNLTSAALDVKACTLYAASFDLVCFLCGIVVVFGRSGKIQSPVHGSLTPFHTL